MHKVKCVCISKEGQCVHKSAIHLTIISLSIKHSLLLHLITQTLLIITVGHPMTWMYWLLVTWLLDAAPHLPAAVVLNDPRQHSPGTNRCSRSAGQAVAGRGRGEGGHGYPGGQDQPEWWTAARGKIPWRVWGCGCCITITSFLLHW